MTPDEFLNVESSLADEVRDELIDAIIGYERNRPRSQQKAIGPSEAGAACARRLAFQMAEVPAVNTGGDPLPSIIGTSMHRTMDEVMQWVNETIGRGKWLTETKIQDPIRGTCDLFDTERGIVLDWKFPGPTPFKKYKDLVGRGEPPSPEYDAQLDLYGLGFENLGYTVNFVGDMFIPRAGRLRDAVLYFREYSSEHAREVAKRNENIRKLVDAFDIGAHPDRAQFIPATPSDHCRFCPWFDPMGDGSNGRCCGFVC